METSLARPQAVVTIRQELAKVIVGQAPLIDRLLLAILCDGHVLLEGTPGVAKTLTINTLAQTIAAKFSRIQLSPAPILGFDNPAKNGAPRRNQN